MSKLENTRKKYKDYLEEHTQAKLKVKAVEAHIRNRALELCKRYPHVLIDQSGNLKYDAKDYYRMISERLVDGVSMWLDVIKKIEDYIDSQHPHQQGKLFGDRFLSSNPSNPDAHL